MDGVVPEILKYVPIDDIVLGFINSAYENGELPDQWSTLNIIPVPQIRGPYIHRQLPGHQPELCHGKNI